MRDVLRHRDLRLLLLGQVVSQAGDWLYGVALIVYILDATGSAAWVAAVEMTRLVPWIILPPFAGLVADRVSRRRVLITCDIVQLVAMLGLAAVAALGGNPGLAIAVALVAALAQIVASPSLQAAVPSLVDERSLASVNALLSAIMNIAIVVGPAVGAVLLLLGSPAAAFALNAVTFAVSAVAFALVRAPMGPVAGDRGGAGPASPAQGGGPGPSRRLGRGAVGAVLRATAVDLAAGIASLRGSTTAVAVVLVSAVSMFAYGLQVVLWAILADERLPSGSDAITLLYVANGIGGLLATIPASRAGSGRSAALVMASGAAIGGLSVAALAFANGLASSMALIGLQGFVISIVDIVAITLLQRALGPAVLGRALGAMDSLTSVAMLAGTILAPLVLATAGLGEAFVVGGLVVAVIGVLVAVTAPRGPATDETLESRIRLLGGLSLFAAAPRFALEGLAAECREMRVSAGTAVIREGDAPDAMYVLLHGAAEVTSGPGRRHLNAMGAGDFFGEIGLLKGIPRTATVTATADCDLLRIEGGTFLALVRTGVAHRGVLGRSVGLRLSERRPHPAEAEGSLTS